MTFLFYKDQLGWPRASGHDVHTAGTMRGLAAAGCDVVFVSREPAGAAAIENLGLRDAATLDRFTRAAPAFRPAGLRARYFSYWGVRPEAAAALQGAAAHYRADVVVSVGLDALPFLAAIDGPLRVWYAADEWVLHHLSLLRVFDRRTWRNVRDAAVKGMYERAFAGVVDRVWVVSDAERRAARWIAGIRHADVIPNGVDAGHFAPREVVERPASCAFWGRLDFDPNIQGLEWFVSDVWPRVRQAEPRATFTIIGFRPGPDVRRLAAAPGVRLRADLTDLRDEVCAHAVAILPIVSGGGIKNKLLEAASLGRPILCTPRATGGLRVPGERPFVVAGTADDWVRALPALWSDSPRRAALGHEARRWVLTSHSWEHAAGLALASAMRSTAPAGPAGAVA